MSNNNPWGEDRPKSGNQNYSSEPNFNLNDFDKIVNNFFNKFKKFKLLSFKGLGLIFLILVFLWAISGFYRVEQGELGVELVFGKLYGQPTQPGLNYNYPSPIGEVLKPKVALSRKVEIGYRETTEEQISSTRRNIPQESLMLTGDQNIVDIEFAVFWKISDPINFLFNIRDPLNTIKPAAESAMREIIGQTEFDNIVTDEKVIVGLKVRDVLQEYLDTLGDGGAGVYIDKVDFQKTEPPREVIDSFNDVQRARQDLDKLRNQAEAYSNSVIPEARGQAQQIIKQAEGYREQQIQLAEGEAQKFTDVLKSYQSSPSVTRERLYLEAISNLLAKGKKIVVDTDSGNGVLPLLQLDKDK